MKKAKLLSGLMAAVLSATTVFSLVTMTYAEKEAEKEETKNIIMNFHNIVGRAYMDNEDSKMIGQMMGYNYDDWSNGICVLICDEYSSVDLDWENSDVKLNAISGYIAGVLPADFRNNKEYINPHLLCGNGMGNWGGSWEHQSTGGDGGYFHLRLDETDNRIGNVLAIKETMVEKPNNANGFTEEEFAEYFRDVYCIRLYYRPDGSPVDPGNPNDKFYGEESYSDFWIIPHSILGKYGTCLGQFNHQFNIDYSVTEVSYTGLTHQGVIYEETRYNPTQAPKHEITLPSGNTSINRSDMQGFVDINQTKDVVINSTDGVKFTFPKGTMEMVEGKETYDFGVKLITDYSQATSSPFTKDNFAFQLNYNYEGKLPSEKTSISIPVDKKWIGQRLYYYKINGNGNYTYLTSSIVDSNGMYTIIQGHCSDYVATLKAPEEEETETPTGTPTQTETPTQTPTEAPTETEKTTGKGDSPKTGDIDVSLYIILSIAGLTGVFAAGCKSADKA